jgi:pSer/pThr/pTyr-binding forkhead associated (FHA) protein
MGDERTRIMQRAGRKRDLDRFLAKCRAAIVVVQGKAEGSEYLLDQEILSIGRGPGVDLAFPDTCMSRKHAVLELTVEGFRIRDMGSTNGVLVNGEPTLAADLKHGDRMQVGEHIFQYLLESRAPTLRVYTIPDD